MQVDGGGGNGGNVRGEERAEKFKLDGCAKSNDNERGDGRGGEGA